MTLALLITAATGAWADSFSTEAYTADATLSAVSVTGNTTLTINEGVTVTVNNGLTISSGATLTVTGGGSLAVNGAKGANGADGNYPGEPGSTAIGGSGQLAIANATITATGGAGGNGGFDEYCSQFGGEGAFAVSGVSISIQTGSLTAIGGAGGIGGESTFYHIKYPDGPAANAFSSFPNISDATLSYSTDNVTYTKYESGNTTLYRYMKIEPLDGPKVTIADGNGEASFKMPQYDVTATYTLKRDISVDVTATMGDGTDGLRYRVKKDGNKFIPADMEMAAVPALVAVNDGIEQKDLTLNQDYYCRIYKLDEQTLQPEGDGVELFDFDFAPGLYALKAFAMDDSDYAGETVLSNTFQLFQGYEITVPAGEYATFYKDENLYADTETSADAELYTIASVTESEAVLSDAITVAPANTPLLVYNKSEESKTFLLIPTTDDANEVTPAEEFVGTLEATTIPASATGADNYALNGYAFVWVKYAIEIGANKCWLQIGDQPAAARAMTRSIVGGDTTNMDDVRWQMEDGNYYDLQGRKVEKPNRKGIYIHNGQKVVVH